MAEDIQFLYEPVINAIKSNAATIGTAINWSIRQQTCIIGISSQIKPVATATNITIWISSIKMQNKTISYNVRRTFSYKKTTRIIYIS
jgi:hypothetical protein